jgi:hypothetical protein
MSEFWNPTDPSYPTAPDHPDAHAVEGQLQPLRHLLSRWCWSTDSDRGVTAVVMFRADGTTLRLDVGSGQLYADVFSGFAAYDAQALTWVLAHNFHRIWKARAVRPEGGRVPIYLSATFEQERLEQVGRILWEGWQEALTWRGQLNEWAQGSGLPATPLDA